MAILITDFLTIYADWKFTPYSFGESIFKKPRCIYIQLLGGPDAGVNSVSIQSKTDEHYRGKAPHPEFM